MNKSDLIKMMSTETDFPRKKSEEVVNIVFDRMAHALANGERVEFRGFGSFKVKHYDGYQGKNPKTKEVVNVKPKRCRISSAERN